MSCFQLRCINIVIQALWMHSSGFNRSSNHDHFPSWSWTAVIVMPYCNTVHQCVMNVSLRIETHLHVHQRPNSGLMSRSDRERLLYNADHARIQNSVRKIKEIAKSFFLKMELSPISSYLFRAPRGFILGGWRFNQSLNNGVCSYELLLISLRKRIILGGSKYAYKLYSKTPTQWVYLLRILAYSKTSFNPPPS